MSADINVLHIVIMYILSCKMGYVCAIRFSFSKLKTICFLTISFCLRGSLEWTILLLHNVTVLMLFTQFSSSREK